MKSSELEGKENKSTLRSSFLEEFIKTFLASLVGATVVLCADIAKDMYLTFDARNLNKIRKERLKIMLCDPNELRETGLWRDIETLSRAVGLKEEDTADLLVEIGARGGTKKSNQEEGKAYWGLISLHPIETNSTYYTNGDKQRYKYVKEKYQGSICNKIYDDPEFKRLYEKP